MPNTLTLFISAIISLRTKQRNNFDNLLTLQRNY